MLSQALVVQYDAIGVCRGAISKFGRIILLSSLFLLMGGAEIVHGQSALDGFDPNANGAIRVVLVQPDGKILVGGRFTTLSPNGTIAVTRNRIARLNPDGTLDTGFNPDSDNEVDAIALQADGKILVGGLFTQIGGQVRNGLARLDGVTGQADSFNPAGGGVLVYSIALQGDGKILVGGQFGALGGQSRNNIARLDATSGLADSFNPNANGPVYAIVTQVDTKLLVGGAFNGTNSIGGQTRNRIARLDPNSGLADSFNPNANNSVKTIAIQADGKILAGGDFNGASGIGGATRNRIARLDPTTGAADSFNPNASDSVRSVVVQADGKILAAGLFHGAGSIGGQTRDYLARLNAATGTADSFDPKPNGQVNAVAVESNGKIAVGGEFGTLTPNGGTAMSRNNFARLETDGTLDQTANLNIVGNSISAVLVQPDGKFLIGGDFTSVRGVSRNRIARLNADGTVDLGFDAGTFICGGVSTMALQADGKILIGGFFCSIAGQGRNGIARLDAVTGVPDSFNPNANSTGGAATFLVQPDGKILVGGEFTAIGGQPRNKLARLDPITGLADSFNPNLSASGVYAIALQRDGKILIGGGFTTVGGQTRGHIARLDPVTGIPDAFDPGADNWVYAVAVQPDGKIIVGGSFFNIGGQARRGLARLDPNTGLADSFNPSPGAVYTVVMQANGKIIAAGNSFVRVDPITGLADSFNPNPTGTYTAGLALQSDGKVLAGGYFQSIGGVVQKYFARLSNDTAALQNHAVTQESVTWEMGGSTAQFARALFEYSSDNSSYTLLGEASQEGSNWKLSGQSFPIGQNFYIRARGYYPCATSETATEAVWNIFLTGLPSPSPAPTSTPNPSPTSTPAPTPTVSPTPTPFPTVTPTCQLIQGFENISTLPPGGWVAINDSTVVGTTGWFQGNAAIFPAQAGTGPSYIAANFHNGGRPGVTGDLASESNARVSEGGITVPEASPTAAGTATPSPTPFREISNWLLTPPLTLLNGSTMTFYTRTVDVPQRADRLQVRMSTNGASMNVGSSPSQVGDFTTLMLDINSSLTINGYPNVWTQYTVTVTGVPTPTTGRLALRYYVPRGGPNDPNADYIGIDTVQFNSAATCPSPSPTPTLIQISGGISYCSNPVPGPVPNVTVTLTGTMSGSSISDGSGNYQFSSLTSGGSYTVTPTKSALTPGSNGISTVDVVATQRHYLGISLLTGCRLTAADVNGDSVVNTVDVIATQRFFLGLSTGTANVGKYRFTPANRTYSAVVNDQTNQNYDTLVFGDVASPFVE